MRPIIVRLKEFGSTCQARYLTRKGKAGKKK
jgi:hypothetical protein